MRNTTKLKIILQFFDIDFSMQDEENIQMTIFNKVDGESLYFEGKSYTHLIAKAFTIANKLKRNMLEILE